MHLNLEKRETNSIESYGAHDVTVLGQLYQQSFVLGSDFLYPTWAVRSVDTLVLEDLALLLQHQPELILIAHTDPSVFLSPMIMHHVWSHHVGLECMLLGAASRTWNVLLHEGRRVVAGIIL